MTLVIGSAEAQQIREDDRTLAAWYSCPDCEGKGEVRYQQYDLILDDATGEYIRVNYRWKNFACQTCGGVGAIQGWELYDRGWTVKMILQRVEITSPPG